MVAASCLKLSAALAACSRASASAIAESSLDLSSLLQKPAAQHSNLAGALSLDLLASQTDDEETVDHVVVTGPFETGLANPPDEVLGFTEPEFNTTEFEAALANDSSWEDSNWTANWTENASDGFYLPGGYANPSNGDGDDDALVNSTIDFGDAGPKLGDDLDGGSTEASANSTAEGETATTEESSDDAIDDNATNASEEAMPELPATNGSNVEETQGTSTTDDAHSAGEEPVSEGSDAEGSDAEDSDAGDEEQTAQGNAEPEGGDELASEGDVEG